MAKGISTVDRASNHSRCLANNDIRYVIRYYSETTRIPTKVITRLEAQDLSARGIRIGAVYQDRQNQAGDFSSEAGKKDGSYAFSYAESIGQPKGTGIFFAVDYDASNSEVSGAITRYFRAVARAFDESSGGGGSSYRIGVYGSGLTCRKLKQAGLVENTWLAQSMGWRESRTYTNWDCKQGIDDSDLCDLSSWEPCETRGSTNWLFTVGDAAPAVALPEVNVDGFPRLQRRDIGKPVRILKRYLNIWLRIEGARLLRLTGIFGDRTQRAVKAFQAKNVDNHGIPLVVDGIVGGLTWGALVRVASNGTPLIVTPPAIVEGSGANPVFDSKWSRKMPSKNLGGTNRGRAALASAIDELKAGAKEIGGNNRGKFVRKYLNDLAEDGSNWCAGFVSWCFDDSGSMPFKYSVGARHIRNQLKAKGRTWNDPNQKTPEPGDLIIWWRGAPGGWQGHIGFVHHASSGWLYTIEGNKTDRVQGFRYPLVSLEKLLGFGRVK